MIDKFAILLISPLGTALLLGLAALVLLRLGWHRTGWWLGALGLAWLWLWSTPAVSHGARARLELAYPPVAVAQLPQADAIVVLGGAIGAPSAQRPFADLHAPADRIWHAARLWRAGKAPLLLLSGGAGHSPGAVPEAQAMQLFLRDLGVPDAAMVLEEHSGNTRQNALMSAALLQNRLGLEQPQGATPQAPTRRARVLLVTSALHMARARLHFEAAGLQVVPAATDHESLGPVDALRFLPSADALDGSGRALKEWVGLWWAGRGG